MPVRSPRTPSYRLHKPTGYAVVTLGGRDVYLGRHGTRESRAEYDRVVAEWLAGGRAARPAVGKSNDLSVSELILSFIKFADGYYLKSGHPTGEADNLRLAMRPLKKLYGHSPARDFGPLALKAVRGAMIEADLSRGVVNQRIRAVVR